MSVWRFDYVPEVQVRLTSTELYVKQFDQIKFRSRAKLFFVLYILFLTFFSSVVKSIGFDMT